MRAFVLYVVTMMMEMISVTVRTVLVSLSMMLFFGREVSLVIGALAGFGPIVGSLAVLAGIPSGHIFVRRQLNARTLTAAEQHHLQRATAAIQTQGVRLPRFIFTVPEPGLNAAVSGRTLYIYQNLFASRYLPGVVAHELGHYHSLDGRMLLALRSLTIPGGVLIVAALIQVLRWLAYGIALILSGALTILFLVLRIRIAPAVAAVFNIVIMFMRMLIIFAVGGVGPALLGSFWRSHFIAREYAADAYAAQLGYGPDLIDFFARHSFDDVRIPWYEHPTHPPHDQRISRLQQAVAPPRPARITFTPSHALPRQSTTLLIVGMIALSLIGAMLLLNLPPGLASPNPAPTLGPTPTLGLPEW